MKLLKKKKNIFKKKTDPSLVPVFLKAGKVSSVFTAVFVDLIFKQRLHLMTFIAVKFQSHLIKRMNHSEDRTVAALGVLCNTVVDEM